MINNRLFRVGAAAALMVVALALAGCGSSVAGTGAPVPVVTVTNVVPGGTAPSAALSASPSDSPPASAPGASSAPASAPVSATSPPPGSISVKKKVDACTLLTQQEAIALAGLELQKAVAQAPVDGVNTLCQYTRDPNAGGTGQVTVVVGDAAKSLLDTDKDTLKHKFTQVSGIGDEAWQEDGDIIFRKDTIWVSVALILLNDPSVNVAPLQQAAKIAVSRI